MEGSSRGGAEVVQGDTVGIIDGHDRNQKRMTEEEEDETERMSE